MNDQPAEFVGFSRGISAQMMLAGYRKGVFAMSYEADLYQWWAPDPRGVLPLDGLRVSRSLAKSCRRFEVTFDTAFDEVLRACAEPDRTGAWIDDPLADAYRQLHAQGHAHSVETRDRDGNLVGGLFVVCVGGLVCGESMFHRARDASKVALVGLVERLRATGRPVLLETQWRTEHLTSLGVVDMPRAQYMRAITELVDCPDVL